MASVRLNGDTSGFIEISAPNVAGSTTITLPATSGGNFLVTDSNGDLNVDSGTLFVDASTNRVGIGTTSPVSALEIVSDVNSAQLRVASSSSGNRAQMRYTNAHSVWETGITGNTSGDFLIAGSTEDTDIIFFTRASGANQSEKIRIDASGRLLVGVATSRSNWYNGSGRDPQIQVEQSGNTRLSITRTDDTNNGPELLFGSTRGSAYESVDNNDEIGEISFQGADGTELVEAAKIRAQVDGTPGANDMPGRLIFSCTPASTSTVTDRMRLRSSGGFSNFCDSSDNFIVRNAMTGTGGTPFRVLTGASNLDDGTEKMVVRADGDLENTNGSYTQLSDASLKENIVDANSQWSDIKQLQIRNFNFKESTGFSTHTQLGLVAQEVETVCPGLVKTRDRIVNEKTGETVPTKSVNLSVLYMKAVKALQEAMAKIEALETANASLEARLTALEGGN